MIEKIKTTNKNSWFVDKILIFLTLINAAYYFFRWLVNWKKIPASLLASKNKLQNSLKRLAFLLIGLSRKRKIMLTLALLLLVIFAANVSRSNIEGQKQEKAENYRELTDLIEKKQNQAEAHLLYSNESGAIKLFNEIGGLLDEYPQITSEQKGRYERFREKLEEQIEIIQRVSRLDDARALSNFANLNSLALVDNIIVLGEAKKLYAADSKNSSIYILDIADELATSVTNLEKDITSLDFPARANENSIYYRNTNEIIDFNIENESMTSLSINFPGGTGAIVGADTYNSRLYLLDKDNGEIYRYNRSDQGFSPPYAWLQQDLDFSDAVDMSIDGHIYVLIASGEMIKLLRGQQIDFSLEKIEPPLERASRLFVSPDQKFIYILEPSKNRLLIFDKTGQFILQYKADKFSDLKDFYIDEQERKIYFLSATTVYVVSGDHWTEE